MQACVLPVQQLQEISSMFKAEDINSLAMTKDWIGMLAVHHACSAGRLQAVAWFLSLEQTKQISRDVFACKDVFGKNAVS